MQGDGGGGGERGRQACRTQASMQDADKHTGRRQDCRTRTSIQDADKHTGRGQAASLLWTGLVLFARVSRKPGVNDAWCGCVALFSREFDVGYGLVWMNQVNDAWCGWVARFSREFNVGYGLVWADQGTPAPGPVPIPNHQANLALRYAENDIPHPIPVHSRDAPCVRPPPLVCVLHACATLDADGTRTSIQDADKHAGRTQGASLLWTGLVLFARVLRKPGVNDAWCGWVARFSRE